MKHLTRYQFIESRASENVEPTPASAEDARLQMADQLEI
jgi:hypothetical protein